MRVLVTGADGFAGSWLVRTLLAAGHEVAGTMASAEVPASGLLTTAERAAVDWRTMELEDAALVGAAIIPRSGRPWDAVVHLAGIAWSRDAGQDPGRTWNVNAGGTARLLEGLGEQRERGEADPRVVVVSTGEVYGPGETTEPHRESDPLLPVSVYAASKVGAEIAAEQAGRRFGLKTIVARPFPHTGPGQREVFVVPAFARRLREAARSGATEVPTGSLDTIRDFLDVRDVAAAYLALLQRGQPGEVYNVASGVGRSLQSVFDGLARLLGTGARAAPVAALMRSWDVPHLVGDAARIRAATGWTPTIPFEQTLTDLVNAETH